VRPPLLQPVVQPRPLKGHPAIEHPIAPPATLLLSVHRQTAYSRQPASPAPTCAKGTPWRWQPYLDRRSPHSARSAYLLSTYRRRRSIGDLSCCRPAKKTTGKLTQGAGIFAPSQIRHFDRSDGPTAAEWSNLRLNAISGISPEIVLTKRFAPPREYPTHRKSCDEWGTPLLW